MPELTSYLAVAGEAREEAVEAGVERGGRAAEPVLAGERNGENVRLRLIGRDTRESSTSAAWGAHVYVRRDRAER
jgi:hypothetical protein